MYARTIPLFLLLVLAACGDGVTDARSARAAYLGLDAAIEKALNLGFKGFNEATSANIPPQATTGDVTMDVTGKVDQGASANKGMRLDVALTEYQDFAVILGPGGEEIDLAIVYDTDPDALPHHPNGTFTGSFSGKVRMSGDLRGDVTLDLSFSGETEEDPLDPTRVVRVEGTTRVTGTATSRYGVFEIDLTI